MSWMSSQCAYFHVYKLPGCFHTTQNWNMLSSDCALPSNQCSINGRAWELKENNPPWNVFSSDIACLAHTILGCSTCKCSHNLGHTKCESQNRGRVCVPFNVYIFFVLYSLSRKFSGGIVDRWYKNPRPGNCNLAPLFRDYIKELIVFCQEKAADQGETLLMLIRNKHPVVV